MLTLRFFVFNLWHFNYDVSWCGPLYVHLVGLCTSWNCVSISSTRLGKFSLIISSNRFQSLALFSFWSGPPVVQMLPSMLFQKPFKLFSFFFNSFFFLLLSEDWGFLLPCLQIADLMLYLIWCWFHLFFISVFFFYGFYLFV